MEVRAVLYVPRPTGVPVGVDVYTAKYKYLHERDLAMIANVLRANTVRLDPWDLTADHSGFLSICRRYGLHVIPTFDFRLYAVPNTVYTDQDLQTRLEKEFRLLVNGVTKDDPILAWSLNYGLPLNATVALGPKSDTEDIPSLRMYFKWLCVLRKVHTQEEFDPTGGSYTRPLAIPLDINTESSLDNVGWYLGFAETVWGSFPDCPFWGNNPTDYADQLGTLRKLGAFDIWIAQGVSVTKMENANDMLSTFNSINASTTDTGSGVSWHDIRSRSATDAAGALIGCGPGQEVTAGCSYPTSKVVIAQFGFGSVRVEKSKLAPQVDPTFQHQMLQSVWYQMKTFKSKELPGPTCASGAIIDGWMDDWDRSAQMGCGSDPYEHAKMQECAQIGKGDEVFPEWTGLFGQYSFFSLHCLERRLGAKEGFFFFDCQQAGLCSLSTEQEASMGKLCAPLGVTFPFGVEAAGWLAILAFSVAMVLVSCVRCGVLHRQDRRQQLLAQARGLGDDDDAEHSPAENESGMSSGVSDRRSRNRLGQEETPASTGTTLPTGRRADRDAAGCATSKALLSEFAKLPIPEVILQSCGSAAPPEYRVEFRWDPSRDGRRGSRSMNSMKAKLFLRAHLKVQDRRLRQQLESEALALQALSEKQPVPGSEEERQSRRDSYEMGMANVHARVMEGYLVWLESVARDREDIARLEQMLGTVAGQATAGQAESNNQAPRGRPAEMFAEALLLRLVESLAEHMLHAPEFIAWFYHRARWPAATRDGMQLEEGTKGTFLLDYELLHAGIDLMCQNGNPYSGGLNFDDINDCGLENPADMRLRKTFKESPSLLCIVDTLGNFQPVFTIKMWVFFIAWAVNQAFPSTTESLDEGSSSDPVYIASQLMSVDASALLIVELLSLLLGLYQGRLRWGFGRTSWMIRRCFFLLVAFSGIGASYTQPNQKLTPAIYWVIRVLFFLGLTRNSTKTPYLPGVPKGRGSVAWPKAQITRYRALIWAFLLACCLVFETYLVAPLASGFHYQQFCEDACSLSLHPTSMRLLSSSCIACMGAVAFIWLIVGLTAFFDIYYMFYLGTAIVGYSMGHTRGLGQILSTAQRHVDLTSGAPRRVAGIGTAGAELSDAKVMRKVFGAGWRMVWSRITEALYDESLISNADADRLVQAANTIRWRRRLEDPSVMVQHYDRFRELRFTAKAFRRVVRSEASVLSALSFSAVSFGAVSPRAVSSCISALWVRTVPEGELREFRCHDLEDSTSLEEVLIDLGSACSVYEIFFSTITVEGAEGYDPTQWSVEGLVDGTNTWKELVVQDEPYVPSLARGHREGPFPVEIWRTSRPDGGASFRSLMRLDDLPLAAGERLSFFVASLRRMGTRTNDRHKIRSAEVLLDCHRGRLPSLTQIIPCYNETVINDEKSLRACDGVNTNLSFIISQYPGEWEFFAQKHGSSSYHMYTDFMEGDLSRELLMEVRMWAAMRSQTVARTIAGAVQYHEVLQMLPNLQAEGGARRREKDAVAIDTNPHEQVAQLILAHQTFGSKKGNLTNDAAVLHLMQTYQDWPIFLVFDFDSKDSREPVKRLLENAAKELFSDLKIKVEDAPRYASVMARCRRGFGGTPRRDGGVPYQEALEIVEILPRYYPLLIGTKNFMTQGKAANQLSALRFAGGHYIQMMDANMGAFLGEACKVPFVLRQFQPASLNDRKQVTCRILGFREFIFTEHHGAVGSVMASAEWSFGTICQRFLAGLDVRMHYGHPDFIDAFWASNRGSLSKASPAINLSEDIFAGFNVRMRGERSEHVDMLAWEKGRESSFNAASLFFTKVSKGNVGVMRSRDLKILSERLNIVDNLSFYFASIAFYLNNWLIDLSIQVYILVFVLLTMASQSLNSVGELGSMLAAEWVISMGIIAMFPRFMELTLEYGYLEGFIRFVPSVPRIVTAFTFINKSIAAGVGDAMVTGEAKYIATGRPNANTHYSWRECYFIHSQTHYYPALQILLWYLIYASIAWERQTAKLPMFVILGTALAWLVSPIVFCPQPTIRSLQRDLSEFWKFVVAAPKVSVRRMATHSPLEDSLHSALQDPQSTVYEVWLLHALQHKQRSVTLQAVMLSWNAFMLIVLLGVVQASVFDWVWNFFLMFAFHCIIMELWRCLGRPEALVLLAFIVVFFVPLLVFSNVHVANALLAFIILVGALDVVQQVVLLVTRLALRPNPNWHKMPARRQEDQEKQRIAAHRDRQYNILVEFFFVNFLGYEMHLARAIMILLLNLATQTVLVLLDIVCGFHSHVLLNSNLGIRLGFFRRRPYQPGGDVDSPRRAGATTRATTPSRAGTSFEGGRGPRLATMPPSTTVPVAVGPLAATKVPLMQRHDRMEAAEAEGSVASTAAHPLSDVASSAGAGGAGLGDASPPHWEAPTPGPCTF